MRKNLNETYKQAATEFARRVTSALGEEIDAIVLYGSVARGEATKDSDIDVLVISPHPAGVREQVSAICEDFVYEQNYAFSISTLGMSNEELRWLAENGSPFIADVLTEGLVLNDNGTFSRVCTAAITASR